MKIPFFICIKAIFKITSINKSMILTQRIKFVCGKTNFIVYKQNVHCEESQQNKIILEYPF